MSTTQIRVELPTYSTSFSINVPSTSTILDVKHEISKECIGKPRVDGQRIIWHGRVLGNEETIHVLWPDSNEPRIVHLSVHPSAWTTPFPEQVPAPTEETTIPQPFSQALAELIPPLTTAASTVTRPATPYHTPRPALFTQSPIIPSPSMPHVNSNLGLIPPLTYVLFRHNNALLAVMQDNMVPESGPDEMERARTLAMETVTRLGWAWPSVLDIPYPDNDGSEGARYVRTSIRGQEYLSLQTPDAKPTPMQSHALQILAYTFPLLSLTLPNAVATANIRGTQGTRNGDIHPAMLPELNAHLQQLGIPPVRVGIRHRLELLRPMLGPLLFLALRAVVLLYIFTPTRKPFVALAIMTWVLYEISRHFERLVLQPLRQDLQAAEQGVQRARAAVRELARAGADGNAAAPAPVVEAPRQADNEADARSSIERVANAAADINLTWQDHTLAARPEDDVNQDSMAPPTLFHRCASFSALFLSTLHPAVWDRRRAALRRREGQIRTEANAREREPEHQDESVDVPEDERARRREEAEKAHAARDELIRQHARRPQWVKDYIERVRGGDWVDHE